MSQGPVWGLVGGIYATSRSPAEVRKLINGIDWDQVLSGVTPFRDLSFRREEDAHEVPAHLNSVCVVDCSSPPDSTQVKKLIWFSITLHFHTRNCRVLTISQYRLPVWQPILSPASHMSFATAPFTGPEIDHVVTGRFGLQHFFRVNDPSSVFVTVAGGSSYGYKTEYQHSLLVVRGSWLHGAQMNYLQINILGATRLHSGVGEAAAFFWVVRLTFSGYPVRLLPQQSTGPGHWPLERVHACPVSMFVLRIFSGAFPSTSPSSRRKPLPAQLVLQPANGPDPKEQPVVRLLSGQQIRKIFLRVGTVRFHQADERDDRAAG
jgi:hypothetical protein